MSGKVLTRIAEALTPDVIDAMADRAKMDRASARKAAELGVPAILTTLTELIVKASGLARLTRALAGQSTSAGPVQDKSDGIGFLLGDTDAGALASTIGRVVGAPEASAYAFLDELTSTILRTLAGASEKAHGGGKAVANLLTAEKDLIAASMPAGLSSLLCANFSSSRLATALANSASHGSPNRRNERPPMGAAASPGRPRAAINRAYWAVALAALAVVAWYVLAASIKQAGGAGSDVVISTLLQPNARAQAQADVAALDAGGQYQRSDIFDRAGKSMGSSVMDVLDSAALALASLGRWLGLGEAGSAAPAAQVRRAQNGGDGSLISDSGEGRAPQPLHFVSPEFRDAIRPPLTTAVERPAGPTIASH